MSPVNSILTVLIVVVVMAIIPIAASYALGLSSYSVLEICAELYSRGAICAGTTTATLQDITDSGSHTTNAIIVGGWTSTGTSNMSDYPIDDVGYLGFDITHANGQAEGRLQWNNEDGTLEVGMPGGNVNLQIGQEHLVRATNDAGVQINNGEAVYMSGGTGNFPDVKLALADNIVTSGVIGIATEDINAGQKGFYTSEGLVRDVDTSAWAPGTWLWLSPGTPGALTSTKPTAPNFAIVLGQCVRQHATEGIIEANIIAVPRIQGLSDVYAPTWQDGQVPTWDGVDLRFEVGTPCMATGCTMTGTLSMSGDARVWKSEELTPANIGKPSSNPPGVGDYQGFAFDRYDDTTEEQVYYIWHLPADYGESSSSVRGHFGLMVDNPPVAGGDDGVVMGFEYKIINPGGVFDFTAGTTSGTLTITITEGEAAYKWHESTTGYVTTTGASPGDILLFRFYRDVAAPNDDYTGDAWVGVYNLEYLTDKLGEPI